MDAERTQVATAGMDGARVGSVRAGERIGHEGRPASGEQATSLAASGRKKQERSGSYAASTTQSRH